MGDFILSKAGRKLYRHDSNKGTVIEYTENGAAKKMVVLDTTYALQNVQWGNYNVNIPDITNFTKFPFKNANNVARKTLLDDSNMDASAYEELTDEALDNMMVWHDDHTSTQNTATMYAAENDDSEIAHKIQSIEIDGKKAVIPNVHALIRIFVERENFAKLDPVSDSSATMWREWKFGDWNSVWTSNESWDTHAWILRRDGVLLCTDRDNTYCGVIPIIEL